MRALPISPSPTDGIHTIDLPLAGFAPGEYALEVKAAAGPREASERTPIRITY